MRGKQKGYRVGNKEIEFHENSTSCQWNPRGCKIEREGCGEKKIAEGKIAYNDDMESDVE